MKTRRGHSNLFLGFKSWVKLLKTYQMAQMDLKKGWKTRYGVKHSKTIKSKVTQNAIINLELLEFVGP